jgi:hypothetical protein
MTNTPAICGQAVCGQTVCGRMYGTSVVAEKGSDAYSSILAELTEIRGYSWINRSVTLSALVKNKSEFEALRDKADYSKGGAKTLVIPGGKELYQDLTEDDENILRLYFNYDRESKSHLESGYYLLRDFKIGVGPGYADYYPVTLELFYIGKSV